MTKVWVRSKLSGCANSTTEEALYGQYEGVLPKQTKFFAIQFLRFCDASAPRISTRSCADPSLSTHMLADSTESRATVSVFIMCPTTWRASSPSTKGCGLAMEDHRSIASLGERREIVVSIGDDAREGLIRFIVGFSCALDFAHCSCECGSHPQSLGFRGP